MSKFSKFMKAFAVVVALVFATTGAAQAQNAADAAVEAANSFDAYRAVAITAGVVGGTIVATIVTDGLFLPAYGMITGSGIGPVGAGNAFAVVATPSYALFRGSMRLLGAISGGLYADAWYTGQ
jgi:hypothetical protein